MPSDRMPTPITHSNGETVRYGPCIDATDAKPEDWAETPTVRAVRRLRRDHDAWRAEALRLGAEVAALRQVEAKARDRRIDATLREVEAALMRRSRLLGSRQDSAGYEYANRLADQLLRRLPESWDIGDIIGEDSAP